MNKEKNLTCPLTGMNFSTEKEILYHYLGCCGCGSSDEIMEDTWNVFKSFVNGNSSSVIGDDNYYELIAHIMDDKKLIEHGTMVNVGFLSDDGEKLLEYFKKQGIDFSKQ